MIKSQCSNKLAWGGMCLICLCVMVSCIQSQRPDSQNSPESSMRWDEFPISAAMFEDLDLTKAYVGMSFEDVYQCYGSPMPYEFPFWTKYHPQNGACYTFYFIPTNEVEAPIPKNLRGDVLVLIAVTKSEPGSNEAFYVLPEYVKGKKFTGVDDSVLSLPW